MSRLVGRALPRRLLSHLRAKERDTDEVVLLVTSDDDSYPHFAMLSMWELYPVDRRTIRVGTYSDSGTTRNMIRRGKVGLAVVSEDMSYYVKGTARMARKEMRSDPSNTMFEVRVDEVYEDRLQGAKITGGITFRKSAGVEPHEGLFAELAGGPVEFK